MMPKQVAAPRFLRLPEALNLVGVSRPTIYRWIAAGDFPTQVPLGGNTVVWTEASVHEWMSNRIKEA